ncbi:MAG: UDP-glucose 4-epimerase GalE [Acidimicrobiales bacterium]
MRVLVTGAAGFIGATTAEMLLDQGHEVVALDDLSTGRRENVPSRANFVQGRCGDAALVLSLGEFDACLHFAGRIEPASSMASPELFFDLNVAQSLTLMRALVQGGCPKVVFSSSAAVYGTQDAMPISEDRPTHPESPYGESKIQVETALHWLVARGRLRAASLRYFNAAGATPAHPERHDPEIHLIPLALDAAAGLRDGLDLYGDDYPTRDGTCVRDYVHVLDLARAHVLAISALDEHPEVVVNLGTGIGHSNREVLDAVRQVTGVDIAVRAAPRRSGDPAEAVASNARARALLGWTIEHDSLEGIVADAWAARRSEH